ncbi:hypothetical protein FQ377_13665 [Arthrobacter echini]|uniref:Uncharacterized protein n=1 Tax=Arthrobacter echini TaxID=1529066 RepID=A0A5D0XJJ3_9MICC|nr:hypothetical protein FQ377_13665 [Arthrobacter echini]
MLVSMALSIASGFSLAAWYPALAGSGVVDTGPWGAMIVWGRFVYLRKRSELCALSLLLFLITTMSRSVASLMGL